METSGGIFGRLGEKVLGWIALGLLIALGIGIWQLGPTGRTAVFNGIWKTLFWLLFSGVLPWTAYFFIKRIASAGTNWAGVGLIAGYTLIDIFAGYSLLGGLPSGGWALLAGVAAVGIVATYNYFVCEYLAEMSA